MIRKGHINKLKLFYSLFGLRGIVWAAKTALSGKDFEFSVTDKSLLRPLLLRGRSSDVATFKQIVRLDDYQLPSEINPSVIVDGGAYVGISTVLFASRYPNARIIAIEPDIENFNQLLKNTQRYENVTCVNKALWANTTVLPWIDAGLGNVGYRIGKTNQDMKDSEQHTARGFVKTSTVSELFEEFGFSEISIMKLDIEGAEKQVLQDSAQWIGRVETLIVEFHNTKNGEFDTIFQALDSRFHQFWRQSEYHIYSNNPFIAISKKTV